MLTAVAVSVPPTALLRSGAAAQLYDAIMMSRPGVSHMTALDGYLAALVAFAAMLGLSGRHALADRDVAADRRATRW